VVAVGRDEYSFCGARALLATTSSTSTFLGGDDDAFHSRRADAVPSDAMNEAEKETAVGTFVAVTSCDAGTSRAIMEVRPSPRPRRRDASPSSRSSRGG
jgi:hypothetical protein